jgi:hypothetical protein
VDFKAIYHATVIKKNSKLKRLFNRRDKSIGCSKTIIVPAMKIATITWKLIANNELQKMKQNIKKKKFKKGILLISRGYRLIYV